VAVYLLLEFVDPRRPLRLTHRRLFQLPLKSLDRILEAQNSDMATIT
jgi:hypothetical protein